MAELGLYFLPHLLVALLSCPFFPTDGYNSLTHSKTQLCARSKLDHQTLETVDFVEDTPEAHRKLSAPNMLTTLCGVRDQKHFPLHIPMQITNACSKTSALAMCSTP